MPKQKTTQWSVPVKNEPGALFRLAQTLSKEGINVTGIMSDSVGELGIVRFLSDKENSALRRPLENAGYEVFETPVFPLELSNEPGALSQVCKALSDENINIVSLYGTADGSQSCRVVVAVDHPEKAQSILSKFSEKSHVTA